MLGRCGSVRLWMAAVDESGSKRIGLAARVMSAVAVIVTMAVPLKVAHAAPGAPSRAGGTSGMDASCPAASAAGAGSTTVGEPANARAIGGGGSATVVWCPPASGAGSVTGY